MREFRRDSGNRALAGRVPGEAWRKERERPSPVLAVLPMLVLAGVGGFFARFPAPPEPSAVPDGPALIALLAGIGLLLGLAIYGLQLARWRRSAGLPLPALVERMMRWEESGKAKEIEIWRKYSSAGPVRWVIRRGLMPLLTAAFSAFFFALLLNWLSGDAMRWAFYFTLLILMFVERLLSSVIEWYRMRRRYGGMSRAAG